MSLPPTTQPPRLLVFYHVPKTGGSSVREWLLRNAGVRSKGLPTRLHGIVRYYEANCFMCLQHAEIAGGCDAATIRKCKSTFTKRPAAFDYTRRDWTSAGSLAVEFHGPTGETFVRDVLPRARELRARYEARNGSVSFATTVREPIDLLFSSYHMWPPRPSALTMTPFPKWVRAGIGGLQAAMFTAPKCVEVNREKGQFISCGDPCEARTLRAAKAAVRAFDVVGVTSCVGGFFDAVEASMRLTPPDGRAARLQRRAMKGNVSAGILRAKPTCFDCSAAEGRAHAEWSWERLNEQERGATLEVARCDVALYTMALSRTRRDGAVEGDGCALPEGRV